MRILNAYRAHSRPILILEVFRVENSPIQQRPFEEDTPRWQETPLDHWSKDIDPVIMSGDEWVEEARDPGAQRLAERQAGTVVGERFMHPTHDTNYGLEEDAWLAESEAKPQRRTESE